MYESGVWVKLMASGRQSYNLATNFSIFRGSELNNEKLHSRKVWKNLFPGADEAEKYNSLFGKFNILKRKS